MQLEMLLTVESEKMLSTEEAAQLLGVTVESINRWLRAGHFPNAWRINPHNRSRWRIPQSDIDAFVAMRRATRGYFYVPPQPPETKAE